MKRTLTALAAATILTTAAYAGHSSHHSNPHPDNRPVANTFVAQGNKLITNKLISSSNKGVQTHAHRDRLLSQDCRDFRYCCWLPHRQCYCFWCPPDDCWYYWYAPSDCYLSYDQIQSYPPQANVVPTIPGGLPPLVSNDNAGSSDDAPPAPPTDDMSTP